MIKFSLIDFKNNQVPFATTLTRQFCPIVFDNIGQKNYNIGGDCITIKENREKLNITQSKLVELIGVSSRTIRRYENGNIDKYKEKYILDFLNDLNKVDETHGILKKDDIVKGLEKLLISIK